MYDIFSSLPTPEKQYEKAPKSEGLGKFNEVIMWELVHLEMNGSWTEISWERNFAEENKSKDHKQGVYF